MPEAEDYLPLGKGLSVKWSPFIPSNYADIVRDRPRIRNLKITADDIPLIFSDKGQFTEEMARNTLRKLPQDQLDMIRRVYFTAGNANNTYGQAANANIPSAPEGFSGWSVKPSQLGMSEMKPGDITIQQLGGEGNWFQDLKQHANLVPEDVGAQGALDHTLSHEVGHTRQFLNNEIMEQLKNGGIWNALAKESPYINRLNSAVRRNPENLMYETFAELYRIIHTAPQAFSRLPAGLQKLGSAIKSLSITPLDVAPLIDQYQKQQGTGYTGPYLKGSGA
jgi:hypothetical protein